MNFFERVGISPTLRQGQFECQPSNSLLVPSTTKTAPQLTQDDYNRALCMLTSDIRFQLHLFLYRRLQTVWLLFTTILCILLPLLLVASMEPLAIVGYCSLWLLLQALGFVVGGRCRKKVSFKVRSGRRELPRTLSKTDSKLTPAHTPLQIASSIGCSSTQSRR